ncbi:MAG: trypsin-like serine protease [Deltaproteobacteria bacterium]
MLSRRSVAAIAVFVTFGGCASPDAGTSVSAVQGGRTDTTDTNVVGIELQTPLGIATCSGSLILPNLVLTARHCVSPMSTDYFACQAYRDPSSGTQLVATTAGAPYTARSFHVTTDTTIGRTSTFYTVSAVLIPPNTTNQNACGHDIAMLRLTTPITGITPLIPRLDRAPLAMETFTAIGFGATDGFQNGAGTRRIRSGLTIQLVGQYSQSGIQYMADQEWVGDTGTCEGDSGGPAIDETGLVIGSVSRGGANTCDQPTYTRVDSYADWIRQQARVAAGAGGFDLPAWIDPPVAGSANFGDDCRSDLQCVSPLSCLPIDGRQRCTDTGCQCPDGWICGLSGVYQACVPDPNAVVVPDAGPVTDGAVTADGGPDGGRAATHSGCTASPSRAGGARGIELLAAGLALAIAFAARRRAQ